ncbi:MAG: hypothetical protein GY829_14005 [Gammaproteobacteria bacterium]|nr:hypothetical protein [Gammaproteobacteria bacterium]
MAELQLYTYIAVFGSFSMYFGIVWLARAKTTNDFYIADGGFIPIQDGMHTGAEWKSASLFISMTGMIVFSGYGGSVFLMGWTGGYIILTMILTPYMHKYGKFTILEFFFDRYYSKTARIVALVCLMIASLTCVMLMNQELFYIALYGRR